MKIRNGFVSNSSSSSFVVRANKSTYDKDGKFKCYVSTITNEQRKALKKFGFCKTNAYSPQGVEWLLEEERKNNELGKNYNYGYCITCNQDDVTKFLLENQIPFIADIHYGHTTLIFDGKTVEEAVNYGTIMAMYSESYSDYEKAELKGREPIQKFTIKQYLKKVTY